VTERLHLPSILDKDDGAWWPEGIWRGDAPGPSPDLPEGNHQTGESEETVSDNHEPSLKIVKAVR